MLGILYLFAHLDKANIGNTKIEGMPTSLGLVGNQFNAVLAIFFIPYILLDLPSNILLKRFSRPSVYMGCLVLGWGICMTLHGVCKNFGSILVLRFMLGVFESGFFPGAAYICTIWYMPDKLASRISWFYCMSAFSGAFSGLLAAAIAKMDGIGGYEGWRWIFIVEGSVTVLMSLLCFFFLLDTPRHAWKWLTEDEIRFLELQFQMKQASGSCGTVIDTRSTWQVVKPILFNWKLYMQASAGLAISASSYGLKFSLPSIIKNMGFQHAAAQLMTAPVFMSGVVAGLISAALSDRFKWRMPFVAGSLTIIAIGYSIIMSLNGNFDGNRMGAGYFALMLCAMGTYSIYPLSNTWAANNLATDKQRAIGVAYFTSVSALGGIVGSFMFLEPEKPKYYTGYSLAIGIHVAAILIVLALELVYMRENAKRTLIPEEEIRAKYTDEELLIMDDKNPLFRYTL